MDVDLLLVRHGRSEGNEAREQSKCSDDRAYTEAFRRRLNREWRLTDLGVEQARAAGRWIRRNTEPPYHRLLHLGVRARSGNSRSSGITRCPMAPGDLLRERSWGRVDFVMPESERYERFEEELTARRQDPC